MMVPEKVDIRHLEFGASAAEVLHAKGGVQSFEVLFAIFARHFGPFICLLAYLHTRLI